jgi:hypothetical protein
MVACAWDHHEKDQKVRVGDRIRFELFIGHEVEGIIPRGGWHAKPLFLPALSRVTPKVRQPPISGWHSYCAELGFRHEK